MDTSAFGRMPDETKQFFNKRVALKLKAWMACFGYKPIHAHILERVHNRLWHERTVAVALGALRTDRDEHVWQTNAPLEDSKKRKQEGSLLHSRSRTHTSFDSIL